MILRILQDFFLPCTARTHGGSRRWYDLQTIVVYSARGKGGMEVVVVALSTGLIHIQQQI
jgi:hypothetical protein